MSDVSNDNIFILRILAEDRKKYYELHGCNVKRLPDRTWQVEIPKEIFKPTEGNWKYGKEIILIKIPLVCSALEENKCKLHGTDKKPFSCRDLTEETAYKYNLTEGCIIKDGS